MKAARAVAGPKSGAQSRARARKRAGSRVSTVGGASGGALRVAPGGYERLLDKRPVGTGPVRALTEHLSEGTAAALGVEQAEQVAGDVLELCATRELALDVGAHRSQHRGTGR